MAEQSRMDKVKEGMDGSRLDEIRTVLNKEKLSPLVCKALKRADVEIATWDCVQVKGGISGNQIYQVSGTVLVDHRPVLWSLFLKILNRSTDVIDISDTDWKREPLAYQEGLLTNFPNGLRAAECYRLDYISDTEIWMWLEDVSEPEDSIWPLKRYGLLARYLGQFNGAYLTSRPLPTHNWLVRGFEREAIPRDCKWDAFNLSLDYLQGNRLLSSASAQSAIRLWEEKEDVLGRLYGHLPQTFSHFDSDRRNVFCRTKPDGFEEFALIDWGLVGIGAIGQELKNLVFFSLFFSAVEMDRSKELYAIALDGYLKGLDEAGWNGDPALVRYGCAFTTGLWLLRVWSHCGVMIPDRDKRQWTEEFHQRPFQDVMGLFAQITAFAMELVDEARDIV